MSMKWEPRSTPAVLRSVLAGMPVWLAEGFSPAGPGRCRCPKCSRVVTTNALGRHSHVAKCWDGEEEDAPAL